MVALLNMLANVIISLFTKLSWPENKEENFAVLSQAATYPFVNQRWRLHTAFLMLKVQHGIRQYKFL